MAILYFEASYCLERSKSNALMKRADEKLQHCSQHDRMSEFSAVALVFLDQGVKFVWSSRKRDKVFFMAVLCCVLALLTPDSGLPTLASAMVAEMDLSS